jgi:hypothetical protein
LPSILIETPGSGRFVSPSIIFPAITEVGWAEVLGRDAKRNKRKKKEKRAITEMIAEWILELCKCIKDCTLKGDYLINDE